MNTGFVTGPVNPVISSFTTLTVVTSFGLSGYDDNVGLTGRVDIVPTIPANIPEPGTAAFSLAGLGVLVLRRARPRRPGAERWGVIVRQKFSGGRPRVSPTSESE